MHLTKFKIKTNNQIVKIVFLFSLLLSSLFNKYFSIYKSEMNPSCIIFIKEVRGPPGTFWQGNCYIIPKCKIFIIIYCYIRPNIIPVFLYNILQTEY